VEGGLITVKEEFLGSVKVKAAVRIGGWEAIALWLALKGYVSAGNTGGFIPTEVISDLPGIPKNWDKAMKGLMGCGKIQPDGVRGAGLVVGVAHGYMLHDYEDHGTAPEVEELRRRKAREQKRRRREEIARQLEESRRLEETRATGQLTDNDSGQEPDNDRTTTADKSDASTADSPADSPRARAGTGPRVREHGRDPSPAQPSPTDADAESAATSPFIVCPADLRLTDEQRDVLRMNLGIPEWAIDAITGAFVAKYVADEQNKRTVVDWKKGLATTVAGRWNNPNQRPKKPEEPANDLGMPAGIKFGSEGLR
jgi:hypothetical protein